MKWHDVVGGMIMLILIFLLVNNADGTNTVLNSAGKNLSQTIFTLQGRKA